MRSSLRSALKAFLLPTLLAGTATGGTRDYSFIGPLVHLNFGGGEERLSFALDGSYWLDPERTRVPIGFDAALEWEYPARFRIHTEAQTGMFVARRAVGAYFKLHAPQSRKPCLPC